MKSFNLHHIFYLFSIDRNRLIFQLDLMLVPWKYQTNTDSNTSRAYTSFEIAITAGFLKSVCQTKNWYKIGTEIPKAYMELLSVLIFIIAV